MKKQRFTEEQIIGVLKEQEAGVKRGGFSIRRAKVKRFDISRAPHFKVFRRFLLLSGIGALALPRWG